MVRRQILEALAAKLELDVARLDLVDGELVINKGVHTGQLVGQMLRQGR